MCAEVLFLLLVLWFRMRHAQVQCARRRRIACRRLVALAFKLMDQERLLTAAALLSLLSALFSAIFNLDSIQGREQGSTQIISRVDLCV